MPEQTHSSLADLDPGTQALVDLPPHASLLPELPDRAFDNLLVVQTSSALGRTETAVRERGFDPAKVGVVPVTGSNVDYDGPLWVSERVSPSDLTGLSMQFSNALQYVNEGGWVAFDNLSTLYMYADADRLYRLIDTLTRATSSRGAVGVYRVASGAMDDDGLAALRSTVDEFLV